MTESTDFGLQKEPPILPSSLVEQLVGENELNNVTAGDEAEQNIIVTPPVPPELLKTYYCGFGPFHPKWLQFFAKKKVFTILLCAFAFLQGSIVSGFTSVILSTIEKRYNFTSAAAGFIAVSYDTTVTLSIIFISYFGNKSHKPRYLGISLIIMGIGAFVFASPQFLFGRYDVGSSNSFLFETCLDSRNFTSDCSPSDDAAYAIYVMGNMLIAIGAVPLYTVGLAYLDEIVHPKYISIHLGVYYTMAVLGPAFGYIVGSSLLSVYVDPWVDTTLTTSDPAWVGAWWISFIMIGVLCLFLAIPFLMFPRYLPDSYIIRQERAKEMAKIYSSKYANEDSLTITIKMFPIHIKRLICNSSFMFGSFGLASMFLLVSGLVSFGPKYFENQFQLSATFAGLLSGGIGITSAAIGAMTGALILYFTKIKGRKVILLIFVIVAVLVPLTPAFLIHCPSVKVAGITTPYSDGSSDGIDEASCANKCGCSSYVFEPVCGADDLTYFSPCRAGCLRALESDGTYSFNNCTCVAEGLLNGTNTTIAQLPFSDILHKYSTATDGKCSHSCKALIPFIIVMLLSLYFVFITQIPYNYFTLRVVADDQRSLALGFQSAIWRIFGPIPGPIIFGALFDASCVKWQGECGRRGNCWVYDNWNLSIYAASFGIPCMAVAAVLLFFAWLTYPKQQQHVYTKEKMEDETQRNEPIEDNIKLNGNSPHKRSSWSHGSRPSTLAKLLTEDGTVKLLNDTSAVNTPLDEYGSSTENSPDSNIPILPSSI